MDFVATEVNDDRAQSAPVSVFAALRREFASSTLSFLMEAHSGLSAKIAEEAGFRALWASGLTMSASLGLRDSNEASWTQVLEVLEYMADAVPIPILVDGDTGYGNFNNVRRLVRKLCDRRIAGVCIEDKIFPKTNSFIGEAQPLAEIEEFCGRIKAGKDSQTDDDFTVVARVEALISGRGMEEALKRAEAYHAAGADAILIHSKLPAATEVLTFAERWGGRAPLVIVPTTYYATPTDHFRQVGVSAVIWANHLLRSAMTAMQDTARLIHDEESLASIEGRVAGVKDIFRITGNAELEAAERRYLPAQDRTRAVILAASQGDLGELTRDQPKCMVDIRGKSLLQRLVESLNGCGVREITVVRGYRKDAIALRGISVVDNDRYADTGEAFSLAAAAEAIEGPTLVCYGDVLVRSYILETLLTVDGDIVLAVDALKAQAGAGVRDLVAADRRYVGDVLDEDAAGLVRMGADVPADEICGEWMGLARFTPTGAAWLQAELALLREEGLLETADMPLLLTRLAAKHPVRVQYFTGHWLDVDTLPDLADARNFT
jgi:phosphoenolpyruvate phosphomutase|nr:phosphoenolpyruvate phosphomutase [Phenylobacterium sp.]